MNTNILFWNNYKSYLRTNFEQNLSLIQNSTRFYMNYIGIEYFLIYTLYTIIFFTNYMTF